MNKPMAGEVVLFPCGASATVEEVCEWHGRRTVHVLLKARLGIYPVDEDGKPNGHMDAVWLAFNSDAVDKMIEFLQRVRDGE